MEGFAPEELIHHTDQDTARLHADVGKELGNMGHPANTVPPHTQPVLSGEAAVLGGDIVNSVSSGVGRLLHGEDPNTDVRTVKGNSWLRSLRDRAAGKFKMFQDKAQKPV